MAANTDFGVDLSGALDISATLAATSGRAGLAEALVRRLTTPHGALWYDFDYGFDLRQFISAPAPEPGMLEMQVRRELEKDERVDSVDVQASFVDETLSVVLTVTDADGPFRLTVDISQITVDYLVENR